MHFQALHRRYETAAAAQRSALEAAPPSVAHCAVEAAPPASQARMPLGFGFGIGTRNYNDISDDDESDDGGCPRLAAGAAHYRRNERRAAPSR